MAVTLPKINITFKQLATSFIQRSERGIVCLVVRDATAGSGGSFFQYGDATQVPDGEFTAANRQYILDALSYGPLRVSVAKVAANGTLADALAILVQYEKTGWITVADGTAEDWTALVSWIKAREKDQKSWKAVCYNTAAPDCMHVVNLFNEKVTFADSRGASHRRGVHAVPGGPAGRVQRGPRRYQQAVPESGTGHRSGQPRHGGWQRQVPAGQR